MHRLPGLYVFRIGVRSNPPTTPEWCAPKPSQAAVGIVRDEVLGADRSRASEAGQGGGVDEGSLRQNPWTPQSHWVWEDKKWMNPDCSVHSPTGSSKPRDW